ncbi:hypothetical protein LUZ60_001358 [Juncus effusus]|nr:hypothetical protein LUZ60_001358 [Juncus effusus]
MKAPLLSLLLLLLSSALLQSLAASKPLASFCSGTDKFTLDSPFKNNLAQLMFLLATKAPKIGFEIASVGSNHAKIKGLALCRGDITSESCKSCLNEANSQLKSQCSYKKDAVIWFDNCLVRYSNKEFFGEIDTDHSVIIRDERNVTNPIVFNARVMKMMNRLVKKAYISPLLFSKAQMELGKSKRLFGLVQCTKDLSGGDCKRCLQKAISLIPSGKRGARVLGGSCHVRFQLFQFFDES